MEEKFETPGQLIDSIDNLVHALNIPMRAELHIETLRELLPEKVKKLRNHLLK